MSKKVTKKTATRKSAPRAKRKSNKTADAAPKLAAAAHFTDDQIRERAYAIYRRRANPSDPTADWFQAVQELGSESGA